MVHELLLKLDEALPLDPPLVVGGAAILIIVLTLRLGGRSRTTVVFAVGLGFLAAGVTVGLVGLHRPPHPADWGELEDLAERVIGPDLFRPWEQVTMAGSLLGVLLLWLIFLNASSTDPAERQRRRLARDAKQSQALGSAQLCGARTFRRWSRPDPWGWTLQGEF